MSKGKQFYDGSKNRREREERLNRRELMDANRGVFEDEQITDNYASEEIDSSKVIWMSDDKRKWYVLDTNLILSCVDVIYDADDENWRPPRNFRPSLDNAHIIIPEVVIDELNHIKDSRTVNQAIARKALRRLKKIIPNSERTLDEIMNLKQPIPTGWKQQRISILPLHWDFTNTLPWVPEDDDNDGWIAVTALAATMIRDGLPVDGSVPEEEILKRSNRRKNVMLLTNDNALVVRADHYGVRAKSYSFDPQPVFTGLRELTVPAEMFRQFDSEGRLSREDFERYLPHEAPLVANEYIAMTPESDEYPRGYLAALVPFANVARYHRENGLLLPMRFMKKENALAPNTGIATYFDAMNDYSIKVIVVTGKAGTGKTFQIVRHSIEAVRKGLYSRAVLIVNPDNGVGYLPGSQERKLEPMIAFCKDAIRSYLAETPEFKRRRENLRKHGDKNEFDDAEPHGPAKKITKEMAKARKKCRMAIDEFDDDFYGEFDDESLAKKQKKVKKAAGSGSGTSAKPGAGGRKSYAKLLDEQVDYLYERYFTAIPYKQAQGRTFEDAIVIVDEAQRIIIDEMETFITRPGKNSLLVVCGDVNQIRYNSPEKRIKNGLIFTRRIYFDWDGCANIHLTDNMRNEAADIANRNYEKVIEEIGALET
ncbi:MAG: PhoH family protein [Bacteroidales bacterium]|nr:PhoH family protein [Bacteroidales bacterium]